jgi:uncharacterized membrane protein
MSLHRIRGATCAALTLFAAACADELPTDATAAASAEGTTPGAATMSLEHVPIHPDAEGVDVNNYGVVVGQYGESWALVWSPTAGVDTLPDLDPVYFNPAVATGINDLGRIVGYLTNTQQVKVPVMWSSARATPVSLGGLVAGQHAYAYDINRAGMIAGSAETAPGVRRAVVWTPEGTILNIDPAASWSTAVAVNDSGKVAGSRRVAGRSRAFVWTQAGGIVMPAIGGDSSVAADINTRGDIAGTWWQYGRKRAFVWSPRTGLNDLGAFDLSSAGASGINDAGTVVGEYADFYGARYAYAWNPRMGVRRLPPGLGPHGLVTARAINRQGHIAGGRTGGDGVFYMTRFTITEVNTAPSVTLAANRLAVLEGDSITFRATKYDAENDHVSYTFTYGDGTSTTHPPFWSDIFETRTWNDQGTYPVRVIVQDPSGLRDTATVTVTVANRAPTASLVLPGNTYEGRTFPLAISALVDGAADKRAGIQTSWDCGSGFSAFAVATRFVCPAVADDDTLNVGVRLRDKDGAMTEYRAVLIIYNAQPVVTAAAVTSTSITAGGSFTARGSFNDGGVQDGPWLVRYFWGDGTSSSTTVTTRGTLPAMSHVYRAAGSYPVTVYVTDKDGRNGKSTPLTVTVAP